MTTPRQWRRRQQRLDFLITVAVSLLMALAATALLVSWAPRA